MANQPTQITNAPGSGESPLWHEAFRAGVQRRTFRWPTVGHWCDWEDGKAVPADVAEWCRGYLAGMQHFDTQGNHTPIGRATRA